MKSPAPAGEAAHAGRLARRRLHRGPAAGGGRIDAARRAPRRRPLRQHGARFFPGDVLIERGIEPRQVKIGQIVTFHEPGSDRSITHRVRSIEARGREARLHHRGRRRQRGAALVDRPGRRAGPAAMADPPCRLRGDAGEDTARPGLDRAAAAAARRRLGDLQGLATGRGSRSAPRRPTVRAPRLGSARLPLAVAIAALSSRWDRPPPPSLAGRQPGELGDRGTDFRPPEVAASAIGKTQGGSHRLREKRGALTPSTRT